MIENCNVYWMKYQIKFDKVFYIKLINFPVDFNPIIRNVFN
jgi:hypothetical protein